ncbi:LysE family translocator [Pseudomonas syringae]|uniref:LysE family translocator n=1 Tax=Pseudomonas syringae TaxID=317 RepID=UPI003F74FA05
MSSDISHLLVVFGIYIIGAASPGPSNMRIMGVAMNQGRRPALMLSAGVISGSFFWGLMAATGISAALIASPKVVIFLKIMAGAYMLFLAFKAGRSVLVSEEKHRVEMVNAASTSGFKLYQKGLMMHLVNPKALFGWIATMTLGLGPHANFTTVVITLIGCAILSVTIFSGYAILFSTAPMIHAYRRARRVIEGVLTLVFGAAGIKLLLSGFI